MIIFNLIIPNKEQADAVVDSILKNRFAISVLVDCCVNSYHVNSSNVKVITQVYTIRFASKSLLFKEIEESLKSEFPDVDFFMMANPIVHISAQFYNKIKSDVTGIN